MWFLVHEQILVNRQFLLTADKQMCLLARDNSRMISLFGMWIHVVKQFFGEIVSQFMKGIICQYSDTAIFSVQ